MHRFVFVLLLSIDMNMLEVEADECTLMLVLLIPWGIGLMKNVCLKGNCDFVRIHIVYQTCSLQRIQIATVYTNILKCLSS